MLFTLFVAGFGNRLAFLDMYRLHVYILYVYLYVCVY